MRSSTEELLGFWGNALINIAITKKREQFAEFDCSIEKMAQDELVEELKKSIKHSLNNLIDDLEFKIVSVSDNRVDYTVGIK